jgi:hypothetical protein
MERGKKMKINLKCKLMSVILTIVMVTSLLPVTALAQEPMEYDITSGTITINADGDYIITGTSTTNTITVNVGVNANITLDNVFIA